MDPLGTVLIVSRRGADWFATRDVLMDEYGYRVLTARSREEASAAISDIHVDLVIAEDGGNDDGLEFITGLRISHPDIIRVLALEGAADICKTIGATIKRHLSSTAPLAKYATGSRVG
jgi:two-component system, NtrC family, response regulator HupR/HoxA